ncbi:MAG: LacI family transcriptional regulator, partial [Thermotogota bacterium]|nr:LacI family transcriptional regulator [Thermotogota bacterium]
NYIPNRRASSLKKDKTNIVGVVIPDISNPFFARVLYAAETILYAAGYNVVLANVEESERKEKDQLKMLLSLGIDALLVAPNERLYKEYQELARSGMCIVFFDRTIRNLAIDSVIVDNREAIYKSVEYLYKKGYRRIAHVAGDPAVFTGRERAEGFKEALRKFGLETSKCPLIYGNKSISEAYLTTKKLVEEGNVEAIISSSNKVTLGMVKALRELKIRVPEDLAIVGFDELHCVVLEIPTVVQPEFALGTVAAQRVIHRLKNPNKYESPQRVVLKCEFKNFT